MIEKSSLKIVKTFKTHFQSFFDSDPKLFSSQTFKIWERNAMVGKSPLKSIEIYFSKDISKLIFTIFLTIKSVLVNYFYSTNV